MFDEHQQAVLDTLNSTDQSVLLTGVAGCGKSTILRAFLEQKAERGDTIVLAPTGIAALNIGGSTIHRAFGFTPASDLEKPSYSPKVKMTLYFVKTIIVDEVSMVRADLLGAMDIVLRRIKHSDQPFGGVRMIFVGDFYQLPPVVKREEAEYMGKVHGSEAGWMFNSPAFRSLNPKVFFLAKSFRQQDDSSFTSLLNRVRNLDTSVVRELNSLARYGGAPDNVPRLCARKRNVEAYNASGLRNLGVQPTPINPVLSGDVKKIPFEETAPIYLAQGARVMCTANGAGYVNGSLGYITSFNGEATLWDGQVVPAMMVQLNAGYEVAVPRHQKDILGFEADHEGKINKHAIASISQLPLQLAYSWTIHKSQGQTLEAAVIDLGGGAFAHGQTYVALSRIKSAAGLFLSAKLRADDLLLDPEVIAYFRGAA